MSTEAFTGLGELYRKARPHYPAEAVDWIVSRPGLELVVDVACGTGILTRALVRPGLRVVGVEPNADMRRQAEGLECLEGVAENLPFPNGSVSLLTCAQALHWFDRPAFYREAQRVLRPDGWLAVLDNNRDLSDPFMQAYESLLELRSQGTYRRDYRALDHRAEFLAAGYARVEERSFPWRRPMSREGFLELAFSSSKVQGVARLAGPDRLREELLALLPGDDVVVPYLCQVRLTCPN